MKTKKLYRSDKDKVLAGVFGGLSEYLNFDATILRLAWVLITAFTGFVPGIVVYIIAAAIIPKK
ncbi:MAG: PspC domain-containing protein [Patescibacteria group bacterium]|nr:PspC domain-containing protein [Patescibacteria group bacterium]